MTVPKGWGTRAWFWSRMVWLPTGLLLADALYVLVLWLFGQPYPDGLVWTLVPALLVLAAAGMYVRARYCWRRAKRGGS